MKHLKAFLRSQITRGELPIGSPSDKYKYALAYAISRLLGPFPLVVVLWLVTALRSGIGFWKALWVYPSILFVTVLVPTFLTSLLITSKRVSDIEWSKLEDRKKYLIPISLISLISLITLTKLLTNTTIFHLTLLLAVIALTMIGTWTFLNFKISGHVLVATITFAGINLFLEMKFLWLYLLLIPIIWARLILKVHTLPQLIGGFLMPISLILLAVLLFGWPKVT